MKVEGTLSSYSIPCQEVVRCLEFSPFPWSCQLLAFSTASRICVVSCVFPEEDKELNDIQYKYVRDVQMDQGVACLAWSPSTSLAILDQKLCIATGCNDYNVRVFTSDLKENDVTQIISGHTDFVNSVTFSPEDVDVDNLASTGDDLTCRVWSTGDGKESFVLRLTSPGMSVCWHHDEPMKLMVGQMDGIVRFFSIQGQQPIMSLDCGAAPLMDCDWSRHSSLLVAAVAGPDWVTFDTSCSSIPVKKRQAHAEGARHLRWSRSHDNLVATSGRPQRQIKVFNTHHQQAHVTASLPVAYGMTWHTSLPIVAVGSDNCVRLWVVEST